MKHQTDEEIKKKIQSFLSEIANEVQSILNEEKPGKDNLEKNKGLSKTILYKMLQNPKYKGKTYDITSLLKFAAILGYELNGDLFKKK